MNIKIDKKSLEEIIQNFYLVTRLKVTIYTVDHQVIVEYPVRNCKLCDFIHMSEIGGKLCVESNKEAFRHVLATTNAYVYVCYAGLIEVVVPLVKNNTILGYAMFGQIVSDKTKKEVQERLKSLSNVVDYEKAMSLLYSVSYHSKAFIDSSASILELCAKCFISEEIIDTRASIIANRAIDYINENLSSRLSAEQIADYLKISRTHLYNVFQNELNIGISQYVKEARLKKAASLLLTTSLSIKEISYQVGFSDANVFIKNFKHRYNTTPKNYRESF